MRPGRMSREDISRTYGRGWIGIVSKDGSKVLPAQVLEPVGSNKIQVAYEGTVAEMDLNSDELVFDHPDSMMVNATKGNGVAWVERIPQRQWHRGIMPNLLNVVQLQGSTSRESVIGPLLDPKYVTIKYAMEHGGAISRNFAVVKKHTYLNPVIYLRDTIVGEVKDSTNIAIPDVQVKAHFDKEVNRL